VSVLEPGTPAPEFTLKREDGADFTRDDLEGRTTVLVFYPNSFSPVCTDQLNVYQEVLDDIEAQGGTLYAVSCDSPTVQAAFREQLGVRIPFLSDWEPKGVACAALGVLHEAGMPQRALIVFGPDATVRWSYQAPSPGDLPGANLIFDGLEAAA
jgi:peroxiredoxin